MNLGFAQYQGIVEFLITKQKRDLETAIREAGVPLHFQDLIRSWFLDPITIKNPALLTAIPQAGVALCQRPTSDEPQPYHSVLMDYLMNNRQWQRDAIENIAATSATLVARLADPRLSKQFRIRGLVVGHIQSGKTASMTALSARAADAGYRMIIVLAGLYNDLRSQTQRRFDQEITGQSNEEDDAPLVQHQPGVARWGRLTRSGLDGDFNPGTHNDLNPAIPKLAVIKKNVKVLEKFVAFLRAAPIALAELPTLVLDDEADQASINANYGRLDDVGDPIDPTKTNQCIRDLLNLLPKCSYVGFTATPFANVLIDVSETDNLYPRDFIACLDEPNNYLGPRQLFGLGMSTSDLSPEPQEAPRLDVMRSISTTDEQQLDSLTSTSEIPAIMEEAVLAFILSCGARIERKLQPGHFSMFIHPSYQTDVQNTFRSVLGRYLERLQGFLSKPRHFKDVAARARDLWENDFCTTTKDARGSEALIPFENVWRHAKSVVDEIEIRLLNNKSDDQLAYSKDSRRRYLVIGGNRLSRGLTLEGLSVSLFTRQSTAYDTLLQMGRWFGYRPGYADLTRIYVEGPMANNFADLARVELELRNDLAKYAKERNPPSPAELMPRIRAHPAMLVTARNKMGAGRLQNVSLVGARQTVTFPVDEPRILQQNIDTAAKFIERLGKPRLSVTEEGMHLWSDVPADVVLQLVESYAFAATAPVVNRPVLRAYIQELLNRGELLKWDVVLPRGAPERRPFVWSERVVTRRIKRKPATQNSIGVLQSAGDLDTWRSKLGRQHDDPMRGGLLLYAIDQTGLGEAASDYRLGAGSVDIVGLMFVFPNPRNYVPVPYVSQQSLI